MHLQILQEFFNGVLGKKELLGLYMEPILIGKHLLCIDHLTKPQDGQTKKL